MAYAAHRATKSRQNSGFAYLPRIPAAFVDETANPAVANLDVNFIYFDGAFYEMSIPSSVCGTQPPSDARWTVLEIDGNAIGQLLSTIPFQR